MTRRPHSRYHDLIVLAIGAGVTLWLVGVALYLDHHDPAPAPSGGTRAPQADRDALTPSRSNSRTELAIPPVDLVRSPSPDPTHDRASTATPVPSVAPTPAAQDTELGSGDTWPNYRTLASEPAWVQAVAECVIDHESRTAGTYQAVSPGGTWTGAYQFSAPTWQSVTQLPGVASDYSPTVQDDAFATLFAGGAGAGNWPGLWQECG